MKTLFEKTWQAHVVQEEEGGNCLLYIDRHLLHEGSRHSFDALRLSKRSLKRPDRTVAFADHYVPTEPEARAKGIEGVKNPEIRHMIKLIEDNCSESKVRLFGIDDPGQGIVHVVAPEQGYVQPGMTIVCGDSHTSTHGAFGAIAFGIGSSEITHVMATQSLWQKTPKLMRVNVVGTLSPSVTAKDVALALIAQIGTLGGTGYAIEYAGPVISAMSMEGRMTLCNLTIEAGARFGIVAPDEVTFAYLDGLPNAPSGALREQALEYWRSLPTDEGASFDKEITVNADQLVPMVTWGNSPQDAIPVTGSIPSVGDTPDHDKVRVERALKYMGLEGGVPIAGTAIDRVFLGSCTNSRIQDLRAAAKVVAGKKATIPAMVVPGSRKVQAQAEAEGLADIFRAAGFEWREPGCSMCLGTNGDILKPEERCASTSNRNFEGRQGRLGRTHLMSPEMVAAAAITGCITDVRSLLS